MTDSFAKKYNLQGKGHKIIISKKTKEDICLLDAQCKRFIESGEEFVKKCKIIFNGGNRE